MRCRGWGHREFEYKVNANQCCWDVTPQSRTYLVNVDWGAFTSNIEKRITKSAVLNNPLLLEQFKSSIIGPTDMSMNFPPDMPYRPEVTKVMAREPLVVRKKILLVLRKMWSILTHHVKLGFKIP
ncbi:hypothetical protein TNCV_3867461 [Trichonephila clavipes]|nr:hypothetical protein TNCV_3867461 [Trichonephila clavipes]